MHILDLEYFFWRNRVCPYHMECFTMFWITRYVSTKIIMDTFETQGENKDSCTNFLTKNREEGINRSFLRCSCC